ncbi:MULTISPECIES: ABC transporter ATP-binding protein [unclassified Devosia]|uniref:ABC transporter ATP-binding protein n=1 Tax=unclassified Devosia TaxID=196773 RepID=UPI0025BA5F81|nr:MULTISPECIES: ABC transporter ATP-binding protein [unclassified Devosia]
MDELGDRTMDMTDSASTNQPLLEVKDLRVVLPLLEGNLVAADGVSFAIRPGRTLGLVGESGCGKTITAQSILKIAPRKARTDGRILLHYADRPATDIIGLGADDPELLKIRGGECAMIFQEPMTSFSPVHTIGNQLMETILLHRTRHRREAHDLAVAMLAKVGIPAPAETLKKYPHHLSGGMRQRAMIAMALASQPRLLIADEPTTALDVTVQAQVLRLMKDLQHDLGMAILYISHDLGVIARMADEVAVMYMGSIVEQAAVRDLLRTPMHPYTRGLMASVPRIGKKSGEPLQSIKGNVPVPINKPRACGFFPRCPVAIEGVCDRVVPPLTPVAAGHSAACFRYSEVVAAAGLDQGGANVH